MSKEIPIEIINIILSYREKHPIRNIICCRYCGEQEYFNDYLYIYHRNYYYSKKYFEIVCSDCNYELCKD
jgi:hypothetical protein